MSITSPLAACKIVVLFTCFLLLSGCWDNKDINHRSLPIIMGLSTEGDNYKVYLDIPSIEEDGGGMKLVKGSGKTFSEAIDNISTDVESQVDLLHLKIIVFDEKYAKQGLKDSIYAFMRSRDISAKTVVIVSSEDLDSFFKSLNNYSQKEETILYNYFQKNAGWNPQTTDTRIWQVFRSITSYTHDAVTPLVRSGDTTAVNIQGSAIFKNGKMVGTITPEETLLVNAFNGVSTQGKIEVMDHATVQISDSSFSHKSSLKKGIPILRCNMKMKVTVLDTKGNPSMEEIKDEVQLLLQNRVKTLFAKTQQHQADIIGLGQHFRNKLTREQLAHWREDYYPRMRLELTVHTDIRNLGNLRTTD